MKQRSPHSDRRREAGVALVEFALILPLLMLILLGMLDFGRAFNYWLDETHIANEGSRWAIVNTNGLTLGGQSLQQYLKGTADTTELRNGGTSSVPNALQVYIPTLPAQVGHPVKVCVKTTFNLIPFIGTAANNVTGLNLTASSTMRLEVLPTTYSSGFGGTGTGGPPSWCPAPPP